MWFSKIWPFKKLKKIIPVRKDLALLGLTHEDIENLLEERKNNPVPISYSRNSAYFSGIADVYGAGGSKNRHNNNDSDIFTAAVIAGTLSDSFDNGFSNSDYCSNSEDFSGSGGDFGGGGDTGDW